MKRVCVPQTANTSTKNKSHAAPHILLRKHRTARTNKTFTWYSIPICCGCDQEMTIHEKVGYIFIDRPSFPQHVRTLFAALTKYFSWVTYSCQLTTDVAWIQLLEYTKQPVTFECARVLLAVVAFVGVNRYHRKDPACFHRWLQILWFLYFAEHLTGIKQNMFLTIHQHMWKHGGDRLAYTIASRRWLTVRTHLALGCLFVMFNVLWANRYMKICNTKHFNTCCFISCCRRLRAPHRDTARRRFPLVQLGGYDNDKTRTDD